MTKLSVCIPTYQRPELVKDVIDNELKLYCELGFALYIFDSSIDDKTQNLVEEYQKNFSNLFYFRCPSSLHSNAKVYQIFQMAKEDIIQAEYLWIRSDTMLCHEMFLKALVNYLDYDLIVTAAQGMQKNGIRTVCDYQAFFEEYAWQLCLFGAVILNISRMIKAADWNYLSSKYLLPQHINFSHVCFYFEQILELKDCRILVFDLPESLYHGNPKKTFSTWYSDFFDLWLKRWPDTINALPDYYKNKTYAIRQNGRVGKENGIFNVWYFRQLVKDNIFTHAVFEQYRDRIRQYSGINEEYFMDVLKNVSTDDETVYQTDEYNALLSFARRYSTLVVYGCGKRALRYVRYLQYRKINFDKFIITDKKNVSNFYLGHEVVARDAYEFSDDTGIILALKAEYQLEVFPFFQEKNRANNLFMWPKKLVAYYFSFLDSLKNNEITGKI